MEKLNKSFCCYIFSLKNLYSNIYLIQNFFYDKLKFLLKDKKDNKIINNVYYKNSLNKHSMTADCTLKISSETEKKKNEIQKSLKTLVKKYINNPEKLLQYMQLKGIKVYKFKNASKILAKMGEEQGFLTPLKGGKALIINIITGVICDKKLKISLKTSEMVIFNSGNTEIYSIARALHKYYGYKSSLPGFDFHSQEIFKKTFKTSKNTLSTLDKLSINDLFSCKEAIARDKESIDFALELSVEYERSKKVLNKIKKENSVNV